MKKLLFFLSYSILFLPVHASMRPVVEKMPLLEISLDAIFEMSEMRVSWGLSLSSYEERLIKDKFDEQSLFYDKHQMEFITEAKLIPYSIEVEEWAFTGMSVFKMEHDHIDNRFTYNPETSISFEGHNAYFNLFPSVKRCKEIHLCLKGTPETSGSIEMLVQDNFGRTRFSDKLEIAPETNTYITLNIQRMMLEKGSYYLLLKSENSWEEQLFVFQ